MKSGINTNNFSQTSEETNEQANRPLERLGLFPSRDNFAADDIEDLKKSKQANLEHFPFLSCPGVTYDTEWMKEIEKEALHAQESTCKIPKYVVADGIMKLNPEYEGWLGSKALNSSETDKHANKP